MTEKENEKHEMVLLKTVRMMNEWFVGLLGRSPITPFHCLADRSVSNKHSLTRTLACTIPVIKSVKNVAR